MKGKGKPKGKSKNNVDDIMNNFDMGAYGDENMDDGMADFEKKFNPEQQFDIPIYDNIDKEFEKFSKMFGADDEPDLSSGQKNPKELSEEDKILNAILGGSSAGVKKKKNNDMEELSKALKMAEDNLNKKHGKDNDAEVLKGIFAGAGNNKKKKDDGMDDLNNILMAADRNLKNKNKDDMDLVKKFLTKEELGEVDNSTGGEKKNVTKKPENIENKNTPKPQNVDGDLYPLKQEQIFHRVNQMKSLTVLEKEIKLCNTIIEYKKKKQADFKEWENKIEQATKLLNDIKTNVESGKMDYEAYKKTITDELNYEQKLLNVYLAKDQTSSQVQKEMISKRINDRIIIINKEINNEIEDEEEEQEEKKEEPHKKEETKQGNDSTTNANTNTNASTSTNQSQSNEERTRLYVDLLLQQYLSAKDYFKTNDLKEQEKDCIEKCKQIILAKKKIQGGNIKDVNLNELPKSIKPEYIYGYSSDDRVSKFKEILSELIKQKGEIEQKKKSYMEKLQKLNKRDFAKIKDTAKGVLDSYQGKINKLNETIESIKEKFKDKWVPAPEFSIIEEEEKVEKIDNDVPENAIKIHIGKTDYDKDNVYLKVKLVNNEKELVKEVHLKGNQDFNETWVWQFEKNEFKSLFRKTILIDMERSYWYKFGGSNVKGTMKIDLKSLKNTNQLTGDYKMELVSKRTSPTINVSINLRTPCAEKQYETVPKEVFTVKKIYPPFNPKSATIPGAAKEASSNKDTPKTNNNNTNIPDKSKQKSVQKQVEEKKPKVEPKITQEKTPEVKKEIKNQESNTTNNAKKSNEQNQEATATAKIDKSMFKDEELADIDGVDYINSLKVLEYKLKLLEAQISKISGRTPRDLMQKKVKMSCKIKMFTQQMNDGDVTPQDYYNLLTQQITHDQSLFTYLKQENQIDKAKLVAIRIKLMNEEITELKQYL